MSTTASENLDLNLALSSSLHLTSSANNSPCMRPSPFLSIPSLINASRICPDSPPVPGNQTLSSTLASAPKTGTEKSKNDNSGFEVSKRAILQNHSPHGQAASARTKQSKKGKASGDAKSAAARINADQPGNLNLGGSCRFDSSLGLLTKKFIRLLEEAEDGILDLNHSADVLEVAKRRIYDITNVLEGIGLIEKATKSHIRLKGSQSSKSRELDNQVAKIKEEIEYLSADECQLDKCISEKLEQLKTLESDANCQKYLFLAEEDIMSLPHFRDKTVIAIKAPHASSIEVPDPSQDPEFGDSQYRLVLRSATGPIDVFLMSKPGEEYKDITIKRAKSFDDAFCSREKMNDYVSLSLPSCSLDSTTSRPTGIHKITPSHASRDDDYWLCSDVEVSATDLWGVEIS